MHNHSSEISTTGSIPVATTLCYGEIIPAFHIETPQAWTKPDGRFPIAACNFSSPLWCHTWSVVTSTVPWAGIVAVCPSHGGSEAACTCAEQKVRDKDQKGVPFMRYTLVRCLKATIHVFIHSIPYVTKFLQPIIFVNRPNSQTFSNAKFCIQIQCRI